MHRTCDLGKFILRRKEGRREGGWPGQDGGFKCPLKLFITEVKSLNSSLTKLISHQLGLQKSMKVIASSLSLHWLLWVLGKEGKDSSHPPVIPALPCIQNSPLWLLTLTLSIWDKFQLVTSWWVILTGEETELNSHHLITLVQQLSKISPDFSPVNYNTVFPNCYQHHSQNLVAI